MVIQWYSMHMVIWLSKLEVIILRWNIIPTVDTFQADKRFDSYLWFHEVVHVFAYGTLRGMLGTDGNDLGIAELLVQYLNPS